MAPHAYYPRPNKYPIPTVTQCDVIPGNGISGHPVPGNKAACTSQPPVVHTTCID